jgi:hypothetical protein
VFRLRLESKNAIVSNTAAAILRQLILHVFEKVVAEDLSIEASTDSEKNGALDLDSLNVCAKDAYMLFQDLCLLAQGEPAQFLKVGLIPKSAGLELIDMVLDSHFQLFNTVFSINSYYYIAFRAPESIKGTCLSNDNSIFLRQ